MKKLILSILFIFSAQLMVGCEEVRNSRITDVKNQLVKICYIPIRADTSTPMTMKNIHSHCAYSGMMSTKSDAYREVISIVSNAEAGKIDDDLIRVQIDRDGEPPIYIDTNGGAKIGDLQKHIKMNDLLKINDIIVKALVVDEHR